MAEREEFYLTPRRVFLGLIVTAAHTTGVYLLGAVTLYASKYIVPERPYPWLGMISGIVIAVLASYMMIRAWIGVEADHSHEIGGDQCIGFLRSSDRAWREKNNSEKLHREWSTKR